MTVHVEESIERYFEGRIALGEDRDALFGHLDRCAPCRTHFDRLAFAQRALASPGDAVPSTELALIKRTLIPAAQKRRFIVWPSRVVGLFAPAALVVVVVLGLMMFPELSGRKESVLTPKGGHTARSGEIEVLCFDTQKEVTAHLREDGACIAPGFIKVIYASPESVPSLFVAAIEDEEVRFAVELKSPKPRSVVPDFAELRAGGTIKVVVLTADRTPEKEELMRMKPRLVVEGVSR
jgi:hypothetical protein